MCQKGSLQYTLCMLEKSYRERDLLFQCFI
ncbi:hypothetical protein LINGRAHAP2_LOCUS21967 [Linum grandiflorum]